VDQTAVSISACLVVRNEEAVVERCLRSLVGVVDEVVCVHDGQCDDRTLEIAARHGARVYVRPLVGHAEAATVFAFEHARGDWILSIDADEFLSDPLRNNMRALVSAMATNSCGECGMADATSRATVPTSWRYSAAGACTLSGISTRSSRSIPGAASRVAARAPTSVQQL
jgi:glycosyltransferase involved in cell wall biosynthesis